MYKLGEPVSVRRLSCISKSDSLSVWPAPCRNTERPECRPTGLTTMPHCQVMVSRIRLHATVSHRHTPACLSHCVDGSFTYDWRLRWQGQMLQSVRRFWMNQLYARATVRRYTGMGTWRKSSRPRRDVCSSRDVIETPPRHCSDCSSKNYFFTFSVILSLPL